MGTLREERRERKRGVMGARDLTKSDIYVRDLFAKRGCRKEYDISRPEGRRTSETGYFIGAVIVTYGILTFLPQRPPGDIISTDKEIERRKTNRA